MTTRLVFGALAGACGGLAMKAVVRFIDPNSFGLSAQTDARTTHEITRRMNWEPVSEKRAEQIGAALHYGFAVAAGVAYAGSAENFPVLRWGRGAAFGAALWLVGDELAVSISGLEDPFRTSLHSHCSALGAHILYGMIVDSLVPRKTTLK